MQPSDIPKVSALEIAKTIVNLNMSVGGREGWKLPASMLTRITEGDDRMLAQWADIVHDCGAEITFQTTHQPGRVVISADYPKDWNPYIEGRGRVYRESITVSAAKPVEQMVKEMNRRLFEATGYFTHLEKVMDAKRQSEAAQARAEALAGELRAMLGIPEWKPERWQSSQTDEQKRMLETPYNQGALRMELKVGYSGNDVDVKLVNLSPEEAKQLAGWFNLMTTRRKARS